MGRVLCLLAILGIPLLENFSSPAIMEHGVHQSQSMPFARWKIDIAGCTGLV